MNEDEEKSALPGTRAHRAQLRRLLDEADGRIQARANEPGLSEEHLSIVSRIIDEVFAEPSVALGELLEVLQGLVTDARTDPGAVCDRLEEYNSIALHKAAQRTFSTGLELGRAASGEVEQ